MQVVVDGSMMNYVAEGSSENPAVLLLHGWGSSSTAFQRIMKVLAEAGYYAVALDYPEPKEVWNVDNYTDIVQKFLEKINVKPFAVIGHSFGGRIMLKNQLGASRLIFIDSAGVKPKQNNVRNIIAKTGKAILPRGLQAKIRNKAGSEDYKALKNEVLRKTFQNIVNEDLVPYMAKISLPTLIIWGENDEATTLTDAEIFRKNIKRSELHVVKDAGHYPFLDNPDEVSEKILEFLGETQDV